MNVILPKTLINPSIKYSLAPWFFLAGPVLGGDDWQMDCLKELEKQMSPFNFNVAIPTRYESDTPIFKSRVIGDENSFERQTDWERYYLNLASGSGGVRGCIIFWLPCEKFSDRRMDGKPYAMDTRGELGEWRGQMIHNKRINLVVGSDGQFPGLRTIKRNFDQALKCDFPIYNTLSDTVAAAILKADGPI
jgi:hypothetical protein